MTGNEQRNSLVKWVFSAVLSFVGTGGIVAIVVLACVNEEFARILKIAHGITIQVELKEIFMRAICVWVWGTLLARIFIGGIDDDGE